MSDKKYNHRYMVARKVYFDVKSLYKWALHSDFINYTGITTFNPKLAEGVL